VNNLQIYLSIGLPTFAILGSLAASMGQISGIREEMRGFKEDLRDVRAEMRGRFDSVERGLELIQGDTHQLDLRISKLGA